MQDKINFAFIRPELSVRELVVQLPQLKAVLEKLGIDYCCGGQHSLLEASRNAGREWPEVLAALENARLNTGAAAEARDWSGEPLDKLAEHILVVHHRFTREQLQRLDGLLSKVLRAHRSAHGQQLTAMRQVFDDLAAELLPHLEKEEQVLFPLLIKIVTAESGRAPADVSTSGMLEQPIRQMMHEHESAGRALSELRRLSDNYLLPSDACPTFAALFEAMSALEADLHEHIHLENNILFPGSLEKKAALAR